MLHTHRFGPVASDGYQYCLKCGFARAPECVHKWKNLQSFEITNGYGNHVANLYVQQCEKCGELRRERIDAC